MNGATLFKALGYRSLSSDDKNWAKPIGCSLLIFKDNRLELFSVNRHDKPMIWDAQEIDLMQDVETVKKAIKEAECYMCASGVHYVQHVKQFDFLTREELIADFL